MPIKTNSFESIGNGFAILNSFAYNTFINQSSVCVCVHCVVHLHLTFVENRTVSGLCVCDDMVINWKIYIKSRIAFVAQRIVYVSNNVFE